jgi:hypothetical protein
MDQETKVRENRARRQLARRHPECRLFKTRRRDPQSFDYGTYMIVDVEEGERRLWRFESGYGLTLDEVEAWLQKEDT